MKNFVASFTEEVLEVKVVLRDWKHPVISNKVRKLLREFTQPWEKGWRLLASKDYKEFRNKLEETNTEFVSILVKEGNACNFGICAYFQANNLPISGETKKGK